MDKVIYLSSLYEVYKELCTQKQRAYFELYYHENLSYSEIAEVHGVSRNAVHSQLKILEERLAELEDSLHIIEKKNKVLNLLKDKISTYIYEKIEELL